MPSAQGVFRENTTVWRIDDAQSAGGDGRSHDVAAESLEATSVGGFDTGGGMQRESPQGVPQGAGADTVFGITQSGLHGCGNRPKPKATVPVPD